MYNIWYIGGDKMLEGMTELQKNRLSEEIKYHRYLKKKTEEECANAIKVSIPTYKRLEDNPNEIDLNDAFILSEVLDWNMIEFFLKTILHNAIDSTDKVLK